MLRHDNTKQAPTYTIFACPNCGKYIGADLFKLKDLNSAKRARFTTAEKKKAGK